MVSIVVKGFAAKKISLDCCMCKCKIISPSYKKKLAYHKKMIPKLSCFLPPFLQLLPAVGKKLKCLYCDRLYGYETNLRAHIRQRHQGIRVPCPFCSRTFTRNNTVRRHIAREHKQEIGLSAGATIAPASVAAAAAAAANHSQ